MIRGVLTMGAAALVALVVWTTDARAGGCAGCGSVHATPQASEQALPAAQCEPAPVYCETGCGGGLDLHGCLGGLKDKMSGLGCKVGGLCSGLKCKLHGMGSGLKCKMAGFGHKLKGLGCHKAAAPCYSDCGAVTPSPQFASEQIPSGQFVAPAAQYPSGQ